FNGLGHSTRYCPAKGRHSFWLLSRYLLIWSQSDCPEDHRLRCDLLSQGLQSPAPAEIVRQVFRGDAMEATQPFLQSAVVGIDVVEVKIRCFGVRFAGHRQDVCRDPSAPRAGNNSRAAI